MTDFSTVTVKGIASRKAVRAALRFLRQLNQSIVPEHVDLSDPPPPQQRKPLRHSGTQCPQRYALFRSVHSVTHCHAVFTALRIVTQCS